MMIRKPIHWIWRAEELRCLAEEARDPKCRAMRLRLAADYDRLAKYADENEAAEAIMTRIAADYDALIARERA